MKDYIEQNKIMINQCISENIGTGYDSSDIIESFDINIAILKKYQRLLDHKLTDGYIDNFDILKQCNINELKDDCRYVIINISNYSGDKSIYTFVINKRYLLDGDEFFRYTLTTQFTEKLLLLEIGTGDYFYNKAMEFVENGLFEKAVIDLKQAIKHLTNYNEKKELQDMLNKIENGTFTQQDKSITDDKQQNIDKSKSKLDIIDTSSHIISRLIKLRDLYNEQKYIETISLATEHIQKYPSDRLIDIMHIYTGLSYIGLEQIDNAINEFTKAIDFQEKSNSFDNGTAYLERGKIYFQREEYQNALSDFNKAIECDTNSDILYNRALLYIELGQTDDAVSDLKQAINLAQDKSKQYQEKLRQLLDELVKQEIKDINVQICTKDEIQTIDGFNEEKAERFIQERKNGKMWYDIDSFVQDFELQPHEMVMIQDRIKFPEKPKNKYGRKIDI